MVVDLTGWKPDDIREMGVEEVNRIVEYKSVQAVARYGGHYEV